MRIGDVLIFLPQPPESSLLYVGHYDPKLVALSVFIAILAALAALDVANRVRLSESIVRRTVWLGLGSLAMGSGIWAMHFIGMLALHLPCNVNYDTPITLWSMLPGIVASAIAIEIIHYSKPSQPRLISGSILLGAGIGTMHYTGMAAMRIDGLLRYHPQLFVLSIVVAVALAYIALFIRYRLRHQQWREAGAAVVMGCAVAGMHYTAMAATYFLRDGDPGIVRSEFGPTLLAVVVSVVTSLLIGLVLVATVAARHQETAHRLRESEYRIRRILETTQEGFAQADVEGRVEQANPAFCGLLGRSRNEIIGRQITEFLAEESLPRYLAEVARRSSGHSSSYEVALLHADGSLRHCVFHGSPVFDRDGQHIGAFALVTDISARIAHEAYVRLAAAVFENTGEGVAITDPQQRILLINQSFMRITGYVEADVIGKTPAILQSGRHGPEFYREMMAHLASDGHWQGEIWNRRKNGEVYPEWLTISAVYATDGKVQNYIGVFSDITHIKRSEEELQRLANYDPLTQLANRHLLGVQLHHALERAERRGEKLAVMELDLDGFKNVNDTLGHPAGDKLLQIVAGRLQGVLRSEDIVARLGGDEFAVVLEVMDDGLDAELVAQKIIEAIAPPLDLDGQVARVTCSIGIALYPGDGKDSTGLLQAADTALYVSKREGRNTFRYYSEKMAATVRHRHEIEQGLRQAIESDHLELWYQPQVSLARRRVVGVEALLRWRHPERGIVGPGEFLTIAAETGLILPLGEWVLRQACRQMLEWRTAGLDIEQMAVNVDGQQLVRSDFVGTVQMVLDETGLPPHMLQIEITESFLLENAESGMGTTMRFEEMGVEVAIDDFGTGYSSLTYLKYLRAHTLKIDKSFVSDLPEDATSAAIIRSVISLARGLGFGLIAEGVETAEQMRYLSNAGCDLVQGYYFSRPMPAAEFFDWMATDALRGRLPQ